VTADRDPIAARPTSSSTIAEAGARPDYDSVATSRARRIVQTAIDKFEARHPDQQRRR
jgi:hypothetical protein